MNSLNEKNFTHRIKSVLLGVAVGDALGVPIEFKKREIIRKEPLTTMVGYGTYNLPPGTWSDDSSLTFCLAEALTQDFNLNSLAKYFSDWYFQNFWTARGSVFDIGISTREAINRITKGINPELAGGSDESSNGNGSLMRISPLVFLLIDKPILKRFELTKKVSSITHAHLRSILCCFYYLEFMRYLAEKRDKFEIYRTLQKEIISFFNSISVPSEEIRLFDRLLKENIFELSEIDIFSSGYVLHTLEASIWCLMTTDTYKDAVLKAVNLGDDSDTTGAVTGGLSGLLYGYESIPKDWLNKIARLQDIEDLALRVSNRLML